MTQKMLAGTLKSTILKKTALVDGSNVHVSCYALDFCAMFIAATRINGQMLSIDPDYKYVYMLHTSDIIFKRIFNKPFPDICGGMHASPVQVWMENMSECEWNKNNPSENYKTRHFYTSSISTTHPKLLIQTHLKGASDLQIFMIKRMAELQWCRSTWRKTWKRL